MDYETTFRGQIVTLTGKQAELIYVYIDGIDVTGIIHPDDWPALQADYQEHINALDRDDRDTRGMKRLGEL